MAVEKRIKMMELRHLRMCVEQCHQKLKDGYVCEGDGLVDVCNAMMAMLHDIVATAEAHTVTVDGDPVVPSPTKLIKDTIHAGNRGT